MSPDASSLLPMTALMLATSSQGDSFPVSWVMVICLIFAMLWAFWKLAQ